MSQIVPSGNARQETIRWVRLLAGPVIWAAHFLLSYLLVEAFCQMGWNFALLGMDGLSFILVAATLAAAGGSGYFTFQSYGAWKSSNKGNGLKEEIRETARWSEGPGEFMDFSGFLLGVLFTATIIVVGLPVLFLRACS